MFLVWKYTCGEDNLRWHVPCGLVYGRLNYTSIKILQNESRSKYADEYRIIALYIDLSSMPPIDTCSLSVWAHKLKRTVRIGVWSTPEKYILKLGRLFGGHLDIVCFMNFTLNTQNIWFTIVKWLNNIRFVYTWSNCVYYYSNAWILYVEVVYTIPHCIHLIKLYNFCISDHNYWIPDFIVYTNI